MTKLNFTLMVMCTSGIILSVLYLIYGMYRKNKDTNNFFK